MSEENYLERMDRQFAEEQRFNRHIRGEIKDARAYMMGEIQSLPKGVHLEYYKDGEVKQEFISEESFNKTVRLGYFYQTVLFYIEMEVKNRRRKLNNINFRIALRTLRKDRPDLVK